MNRKQRRSQLKVTKSSSKKNTPAVQVLKIMKELQERGVIRIHQATYIIEVDHDKLWKDRDQQWKQSTMTRFHAYLDALTRKDPDKPNYQAIPLTIKDMATGEVLDIYKPE